LNSKRGNARKASMKLALKAKKVAKKEKPVARLPKPMKPAESVSHPPVKPSPATVPSEKVREKPDFKIMIERIHSGTVLGDMMVVFPRTRDVLKKYGLNLEVDEAGDIYMSLEAFAALKGLNTESFIRELEAASRVPSPTPTVPALTIQTSA
jgi:hypothetical protein